jgi:hypothetical protein
MAHNPPFGTDRLVPQFAVSTPVQAAQLVSLYLVVTPVLWLLGLLTIAGAALVLWLAAARCPDDRRIGLLAALWLAVPAAQTFAVIYNWARLGEPGSMLVGHLASFPVVGWLFFAAALAAGQAWRLDSPKVVRGVMVLGGSTLAFSALALGIAAATGLGQLEVTTPVRYLAGANPPPAVEFYATAVFYLGAEASFGLPRLVLFFPWSTALGFGGICIFFIAFCERQAGWRWLGFVAGVVIVLLSFSRAAAVILPICLLLFLLLRSGPGMLAADPVALMHDMMSQINASRAGSSQARDLIYAYSWQGFLDSPLFGQGWIGPSVIRQEVLPIGSHSTLYGTLYTGGAVTFAALACAGTALAIVALRAALVLRSTEAVAAASIVAAFIAFGYGEGLYNLILPCLFAFLFVGGALSSRKGQPV